jgi:hypothetical protein
MEEFLRVLFMKEVLGDAGCDIPRAVGEKSSNSSSSIDTAEDASAKSRANVVRNCGSSEHEASEAGRVPYAASV